MLQKGICKMGLLTVEISEKLLAKLRNTGRPIEDVVVETLEEKFIDVDEVGEQSSDSLSREELIQRLVAAGLIREPGTWDTPGARAWRELSAEEKKQYFQEMESIYFPDSFASNLISQNRR